MTGGRPALARSQRDAMRLAHSLATVIPIDEASQRPRFSSPAAELRYTLERVKAVVQELIDAIDEVEGDPDLELEEDVGADDFGEPDDAA